MNLDEYIKKIGYSTPKMSSVYDGYSNVFKEYYKWVNENLVFLESENNKTIFACFRFESKEYKSRIEKKEYCYKDFNNIATREEIDIIEKKYSDGFNDGFNDVEFQRYLTRNIIDNIVFRDYFSHSICGMGILRTKGHSINLNRIMLLPEYTAYREGYYEGKRFKSYFLYVEYYDQFKDLPEPFLRPIQYFYSESTWGLIQFTRDVNFDFNKVRNIEITDNRLMIKQSREVIIEFFKTRLTDWYSIEDVEHFLNANFKCFEDKKTPKILISVKENTRGLQSKLYKWTYEFYRLDNYKGEKVVRYAEMLKKNFDVFKGSSLRTIKTAIRAN